MSTEADGAEGSGKAWRGDVLCGLVLAATGAGFAVAATRMPAFEDGIPGPGLAPLLLAVLLVALGLSGAGFALWRQRADAAVALSREAGIALVLLALAVALFDRAGFVPTVLGFFLAYLILVAHEPVGRAVLFSAAITAGLWGLFVKALGVGLPPGLIGHL